MRAVNLTQRRAIAAGCPCLFRLHVQSSSEMLLCISNDFLKGEGSLEKHLRELQTVNRNHKPQPVIVSSCMWRIAGSHRVLPGVSTGVSFSFSFFSLLAGYLGVSFSFQQTPLDEYDFKVGCKPNNPRSGGGGKKMRQ